MKLERFLTASAVILVIAAGAGSARAATVVTEFEGSRAGVREFCERPGRELMELAGATMCTVVRTGAMIFCDDGGDCYRRGYNMATWDTGRGSLTSPGFSTGAPQPNGGSGGGTGGGGTPTGGGGGAPTGGGGGVVIIGTGTYGEGGGSSGGTGGTGGGSGGGGGGGGIDNPPTQQN